MWGPQVRRECAGSCKKSNDGAGVKEGFSGSFGVLGEREAPWRRALRGEAVAGVWAGGGRPAVGKKRQLCPTVKGRVAVARMALRHGAGQAVSTRKARRQIPAGAEWERIPC